MTPGNVKDLLPEAAPGDTAAEVLGPAWGHRNTSRTGLIYIFSRTGLINTSKTGLINTSKTGLINTSKTRLINTSRTGLINAGRTGLMHTSK